MSGVEKPRIFVIGLGPGGGDETTPRALRALERCDVIIGYSVYAEMAKRILPEKDVRAFPMRQEIERCRAAVEIALSGKIVGVVSGGDPGVYGMAGVMLEIAEPYGDRVDIEIVPGVTACCSAASVLGAPIAHDFAVISLSDLLTPWDAIERRIELASEGDFVICIYNPSSAKRADYLRRACDIALRTRSAETPAAWVRMAGREGESCRVLTLGGLRDERLDMFCTAFIGNSLTKAWGGRMVTSRGYKL
ncbi:MAG: precorrin-3B C(17)-methyltransferase [Synergistaceae bacterium]|jgi:precorrin-3B C17-methyltransferase|nr:precorrin-3B C(17)-methyltransferase [Synergistaceae bacterium]